MSSPMPHSLSVSTEVPFALTRVGTLMQPSGDPSEADGVLNPATVWTSDGQLHLLPRLVAAGNVSRIGRARVVLDEAQAVKNSLSRGAKAVRRLDADHRVALTGTPVENRLAELWSIMDFLNPALLGSALPPVRLLPLCALDRPMFALPCEPSHHT